MISILIPTYNQICFPLVQEMHQQAMTLQVTFEIIVADDASTLPEVKQENQLIEHLPYCTYLQLEHNVGPARIRNLLIQKAQYDYFLLMDADTFPTHAHFLAHYLDAQLPNSVICGGFVYERTDKPACPLRYYYGIQVEEVPAYKRNIRPYDRFISMCFLADKSVFQTVHFNEQMHFGYEDTFFGLQLEEAGIRLVHIDNPVYHRTIDNAESYLHKIRKAIRNLLPQVDNPYASRIRLLYWYHRLEKWRLNHIVALLFKAIEPCIVKNLKSKHPSLYLFAFYKLGYLCCQDLRFFHHK